jgi:hypothetical protein
MRVGGAISSSWWVTISHPPAARNLWMPIDSTSDSAVKLRLEGLSEM